MTTDQAPAIHQAGVQPSRLPGHSLLREGAPLDERGHFVNGYGGVGGHGRARCTCGEMSEPLDSGAARKAWHRTHKVTVSADAAPAANAADD